MKMRRTLAAMMSGILAMSPAGVIFADEAVEIGRASCRERV